MTYIIESPHAIATGVLNCDRSIQVELLGRASGKRGIDSNVVPSPGP